MISMSHKFLIFVLWTILISIQRRGREILGSLNDFTDLVVSFLAQSVYIFISGLVIDEVVDLNFIIDYTERITGRW